uniref:Uncharacterized protein TCIL3000_11_9610 n=1 Tax=Trypanosoma congolense (strain IL3000) TaxID=1068625 RepID=G0V1H3_TRYCI|nr:unnamed protein product [Trypanosoma congolense IL3000]
MTVGLSSSKGVLALLEERNPSVVRFALERLRPLVDTYWCEISDKLSKIEELSESSPAGEETRKLAALIASHVYFHLGAYDDSVNYALAAGSAFNFAERSPFTETILSCCIDKYVHYQEQPEAERQGLDPRLESLFTTLTDKWITQDDVPVKELVGFAIRARRLCFLEKVLRQHISATKSAAVLNFTFHVASVLVRDIAFRRKILEILVKLYTQGDLTAVDYFSQVQCLLFLGNSALTVELIEDLINSDRKAIAYQLAFDMCEYGSQEFISAVADAIERKAILTSVSQAEEPNEAEGEAVPLLPSNQPEAAKKEAADGDEEKKLPDVYQKLLDALTGGMSASLYLNFLYANCNADIHVLNRIRQYTDQRRAVAHNATVIAHAFMYSGTTIDVFLRNDVEWLARASCWSRFVAAASVGVIHYGHVKEGFNVVEPHLPKGDIGLYPYSEAGALYALGLIHAPVCAGRNRKAIAYLRDALHKYYTNVYIIHGASLGIGLAAMGLRDAELSDSLLPSIGSSHAVASEGAALGIGLIMMGSGNRDIIDNLKSLAQEESQREKTIRGLSMAMALVMLGREDECWVLANQLLDDADPWMKLGGCFMLGLGYAGVEDTKVLERLLSVAVKDTSDDVRRNAATMIGFLTIKDPGLCVDLTRVLVDSYNPHIRYGVGMALGVAAAGTGRADVIEILWELKDDLVDFVRQGAYIALALVMVQMTEAENPKVKELRDIFAKKIVGRKEDMCSKFGCIVASGLLDAGGRNCTFALHQHHHRLDKAVAGMFVFMQHWYWFPYFLMISLAMRPTCFIGLNENLQVPVYKFKSNAPPSRFALPKSVLAEKKEAKAAALKAVVLSTTKKEQEFVRLKRIGSAAKDQEAEGAENNATTASPTSPATATADKQQEKEEQEPTSVILSNTSRVTARQLAVITHDVDGRFVPIKPNFSSICILRDTRPSEGGPKLMREFGWNSNDDDDAPPPEPFTWP